MTKVKLHVRRSVSVLTALGFLLALMGINLGFLGGQALADQLTNRRMILSSSSDGNTGGTTTAGSYTNGAKTKHTFKFRVDATMNVGSVLFQYCTTAIGTCTAPGGLDAHNLSNAPTVSGWNSAHAFALDTATSAPGTLADGTGCSATNNGRENCILMKRTVADSETFDGTTDLVTAFGGGASDYIKNPTSNGSFFVHVYLYSDNAYTTRVEYGTVASSIQTPINITAKVKETLGFSVTADNSVGTLPAPGASCAALTGTGNISMGDSTDHTLSIVTSYDAHSYFRLFTNSANGTVVQYSGDTLKKGSTPIAALSSKTASSAGSEQFGLAIDSSDTVTTRGYSFTQLTADTNYDSGAGTLDGTPTPAQFDYSTGSVTTPVTIASSTGYVACDTGSVRYVANISPNTPAGVYTTTINYYAVPTY
jgi:hypothetical protein